MAQLEPQTKRTRQRRSATHTGHRTGGRSAGALFRPLRLLYDSLPPAHHQVPVPDRYSLTLQPLQPIVSFVSTPRNGRLPGVLRLEVVSLPEGRNPRELH